MIRLQPLPWVVASPAPATNAMAMAMAIVTVHPVFTERQVAIEPSGVIFLRVHLADPSGRIRWP
jgi:hypothetical protein